MTSQALPFLNDGALAEIRDEHLFVDTWSLTAGINHFDNCLFQESVAEINDQYTDPSVLGAGGVLAEFDPADPEPFDAADEFGQMLHIAQDFYSHSNWVELGRNDLFDAGTGQWSVTDDWQVFRDDIAIMGRPTSADWTISNGPNYVPELTRPDGAKLRGLVSGVNEDTLEADNGCAEGSAFEHGEGGEGLNKDRDLPTKPLWAPAYDFAVRQTTHEWCRLLHLLYAEHGERGPATAMGLWLANSGSPHPEGTPCAPAPSGPVKVSAKATSVEITEDTDDYAGAEINTRLILFGRDLRQTVRSQAPRITDVDETEPVTAPPAVSFCVDATDSLAVTVQGWDDDDESDNSDGVPGHFDNWDPYDGDDALAGVTQALGPASDAEGTYSGSSQNMNLGFQIDVSIDDSDQDGLSDDPDSDDDGLMDGIEVEYGTDPNEADSDNDRLLDGSDVEFVQNAVATLEAGDLKPQGGGSHQAMASVLDAVEQLLLSGSDDGAVTKLQNLRKRPDGCGSSPDGDDWIIVCESQTEIGRSSTR